jgi:hypothetical protein
MTTDCTRLGACMTGAKDASSLLGETGTCSSMFLPVTRGPT